MSTEKQPVLQHRADAEAAPVMGGSIAVRLRASQTAGSLGMIENILPAGFANLPLHIHPGFDEAVYVLEGELKFRVGDEVITATPGTLVYAPGAVPHTFAELTGLAPVRFLLWVNSRGTRNLLRGSRRRKPRIAHRLPQPRTAQRTHGRARHPDRGRNQSRRTPPHP